jgi:transposase
VFLAKSKDGDYHQEMNSFVFLEWFENQLMPAMNNPSLVVLDNASYHNIN